MADKSIPPTCIQGFGRVVAAMPRRGRLASVAAIAGGSATTATPRLAEPSARTGIWHDAADNAQRALEHVYGESVTYQRTSRKAPGPAVAVPAIIDHEHATQDVPGGELATVTQRLILDIRRTAVDVAPRENDTITTADGAYMVGERLEVSGTVYRHALYHRQRAGRR